LNNVIYVDFSAKRSDTLEQYLIDLSNMGLVEEDVEAVRIAINDPDYYYIVADDEIRTFVNGWFDSL